MAKQLEILNLNTVNEAKSLMQDRFQMMMKYFIEDTEMYMQEIERGVRDHNAQIVLSPAHTIKSSAKQLGVERVSDAAKQLEFLCRDMIENNKNDYQQLEDLYAKLKEEVAVAIPQLNTLL